MKFTLINTQTSDNTLVYDIVNEVKDKEGNITTLYSETLTDRFFVSILLTILVDLELEDKEIQNPTIIKNLIVESNRNMTAGAIADQRAAAVTDYMNSLNK